MPEIVLIEDKGWEHYGFYFNDRLYELDTYEEAREERNRMYENLLSEQSNIDWLHSQV